MNMVRPSNGFFAYICVRGRGKLGSVMRAGALLLISSVTAMGSGAWAQSFPSAPVRVVIPYPAGAGVDLALRILAPALSKNLGQSVVIENRPGAGAMIGMDHVARSQPNGYTIGIADTGPLAINPATSLKLSYDPLKDFAPVTMIATLPTFLTVHPNLNVNSVAEFIALAKNRPGISYASGGTGTNTHLAMEMLKLQAGINLVHVPYKGTAPALAAVVSGDPPVLFGNFLSTKPFMDAGRLRVLAVASGTRSQAAPQLPTVAEGGVAGFEFTGWFGVIAPAGTPPAIVERLAQAFRETLVEPEIRQRLLSQGSMEAAPSTPASFGEFIRKEIDMYAKLVKQIGLKPE